MSQGGVRTAGQDSEGEPSDQGSPPARPRAWRGWPAWRGRRGWRGWRGWGRWRGWPARQTGRHALGWPRSAGGPTRLAVVTFAATQAVLLAWWVALYPATVSYDSVMYVWQATTGNWTTQHSVAYNSLVWLALQTTGGLGVLTLAQTVAMAAALAHLVTGVRRLRVSGRWLATAAIAATCLPAVGTFTVYVSKDVPFVIGQVLIVGTVARILATRSRPATTLLVALAAEFTLLALVRQNAFVVIAVTAILIAVVLWSIPGEPRPRWRVLAAGAAAIAVGFVTNLAVYPALGVRPAGSELLLGPVYADIAVAYADRPEMFTASDTRLMSTVAPLAYWSRTANCYDADDTVTYGAPEFNFAAARQREGELFDLWLRLVKRMPDTVIQTRICRGSIAWNPFPGPARGRTVKIPVAAPSRLYGFSARRLAQSPFADAIQTAPRRDPAHTLAVFARRVSDTRSFEWFAWRGATWAYVAYLAVIMFARRRRDIAALGLAAVVLANQVNVAMNNPGQLVRYMMGPLIIGILLLPLAFVRRDEAADAQDQATH